MFGLTQKDKNNRLKKLLLKSADVAAIDGALRSGAEANAVLEEEYWSSGKSPLQVAIENYDGQALVDVMKKIIEHGGNPDAVIKSYGTLVHCAAAWGKSNAIDYLVSLGASYHEKNKNGATPLFFALQGKKFDTAQNLIAKGALDFPEDAEGLTVLAIACERNAPLALVQMMIEAGIDINKSQNGNNQTPLYYAVKNNNEPLVAMLLAQPGIRLEAKDGYNNTLMHFAVDHKNVKVISSLLAKGAPYTVKNSSDRTPFDMAINSKQSAVIEIFVKNAADKKDVRAMESMIWTSIEKGYVGHIKKFIETGLDPNYCDSDGKTLLMHAAKNNEDKCIEALYACGASLDIPDHKGKTVDDHAGGSAARDALKACRTADLTRRHFEKKSAKPSKTAAPAIATAAPHGFTKVNDHSVELNEGGGLTLTFNFMTGQVIYRDVAAGGGINVIDFDDIPRADAIKEARMALIELKGNPPEIAPARRFKV